MRIWEDGDCYAFYMKPKHVSVKEVLRGEKGRRNSWDVIKRSLLKNSKLNSGKPVGYRLLCYPIIIGCEDDWGWAHPSEGVVRWEGVRPNP